jgi:hypothetical protein
MLSPWLDSTARYRVSRWPNFGLIRPLPSHIRVAAALSSAAADLSQIASRAHVPIQEAVRALNALSACGLVTIEESSEEDSLEDSLIPVRPPGGFKVFLRNVRRHLGIRTGT